MKILGIETSCDESALALIEFSGECFTVLDERLYSQIDKHQEYGGVLPSLAKREHSRILAPLTKKLLEDTNNYHEGNGETKGVDKILEREPDLYEGFLKLIQTARKPDIDYIAVTVGPGLAPALWVGVNWARTLAKHWGIPIIPVNHMEGHIVSALIENNKFIHPKDPMLSLLVSGGHTELVLTKKGKHTIIGATRDDAVGEAFDKVARLLGLPYPGGPHIAHLASKARERNIKKEFILPRPLIKDKETYDFSFAGLKTAVRYTVDKQTLTDNQKMDLAREFEDAAVESLIGKAKKAIEEYGPKTVVVGGGVSANERLRKEMSNLLERYPNITLLFPQKALSTDNAVMIALTAYHQKDKAESGETLEANSRISL